MPVVPVDPAFTGGVATNVNDANVTEVAKLAILFAVADFVGEPVEPSSESVIKSLDCGETVGYV
tara:strand:+ start:476 stop:667 length:192 start_codon:yes stop_codon:yes gene_type:complete